jgi:hypothetical protein
MYRPAEQEEVCVTPQDNSQGISKSSDFTPQDGGFDTPQDNKQNIIELSDFTPQDDGLVTPQDGGQITPQDNSQSVKHINKNIVSITQLVQLLGEEMSRLEIQEKLGLSDRKYFRTNYLNPAIEQDFIKMTMPEKFNSKNQKYSLTEKGKMLKNQLKNK